MATGTDGKGRSVIREVMWKAWEEPGLGHLRLALRESGVLADGLVLGVADGHPSRLSYEVRCDPYWRVRAARVGVPGESPRVEQFSDGGQLDRTRRTGHLIPKGMRVRGHLRDAVHELAAYTQARPRAGESAEIAVAYLEGAELQPWPEPQRYTRLQTGEGGAATNRFVSLDGGFRADLPVDPDSLVMDYPGRFRRDFP